MVFESFNPYALEPTMKPLVNSTKTNHIFDKMYLLNKNGEPTQWV